MKKALKNIILCLIGALIGLSISFSNDEIITIKLSKQQCITLAFVFKNTNYPYRQTDELWQAISSQIVNQIDTTKK